MGAGRCEGCKLPTCVGCRLRESVPFRTHLEEVVLEEGASLRKGVIMRAQGKFGHAGRITENGRLYRRSHVEREFTRLNRQGGEIQSRAMVGEADHPHPTVGGPSIRQTAFAQTGLGLNANGEVMGTIDVVGTEAGKDLAALIRAGIQVGFSSRARGTTTRKKMTQEDPDWEMNQDWDGKEFEEVNEDLFIVAYDAVIGPAITDAYVGNYTEQSKEVSEMGIKLEDVLKDEALLKQVLESEAVKKVIEASVKAAKEEMERKWAEELKPLVKEHMVSEEFFNAHFEVEDDEGIDEAAAKCAECDAVVPKGAKFCPSCGVRVAAAKKEQSQDEKDKLIDDLKKRMDAMEAAAKEKDAKLTAMEKKDKEREEDDAVEAITAEALQGKAPLVVESVRSDMADMAERGERVALKDAKAFVEKRVKKYEAMIQGSGGSLTEAGRAKGVEPGDADEVKKVEEKKQEQVDNLLGQLD